MWALCACFFMIMLDSTIVTVAIPTMLTDLHANLNEIVWVNSVYLLANTVPLLITGRLGDRFGDHQVRLATAGVASAVRMPVVLVATTAIVPHAGPRLRRRRGAARATLSC